ncbi:Flp pilus assembly protein CpaB [Sphingomonas sp. ac-8]|uniref:Flp pilus assembly protein CpaB n=1 Tax=Sphingomonas sp. ac-8 TaxID=3242977 RepID=UPI003A80BD33
MDSRKVLLLVGALFVAAITAFMARNLMQGAPTPVATAAGEPVVVEGPKVLVAKRALPVGTIIDAGAIAFQPWPKDLVTNAYYTEGASDSRNLVGTVVRYAIPAGQPITQGAVVKPGDRGFLAAALAPGMRAVTVPVSTQGSVGGFVFPGDRVDLILTQTVTGGGDGEPLKASETMLRNLRVLATDQRTDKQVDDNGKTVVDAFSTVTLEATPRIAEKIAVAQTVGQLSLSLRSLADNSTELEEAIADGDADLPDGDDPKAERAALARLAARPIEGGATYSTGADVSRFQRSSVPGKPQNASPMINSGPMMPGVPVAPGQSATPTGPSVRVARGSTLTVVPIGGKN